MKSLDAPSQSSFRKSASRQAFLGRAELKVAALDGLVTRRGTAADALPLHLPSDTLSKIAGVTPAGDALATTSARAVKSTDTALARQVKLALLCHRHVSFCHTRVAVRDQVVTLTGRASCLAQKELTGEYASDIAGVREVRNEMTLELERAPAAVPAAATGQTTDTVIRAWVVMALHLRRPASASSPRVETHQGVVTLTGVARSAADKSLVGKLARDIRGVVSVNNQMTVSQDQPACQDGERL